MWDSKRILRVGAVMVIAAGTGHVMQYGGAMAERFGLTEPSMTYASPQIWMSALPLPVPGEARGLSFVPGVAEIRPDRPPAQRLVEPGKVRVAALETATDAVTVPQTPQRAAPVATCDATLTATTIEAAMVRVTMEAPCRPNATVTLRHSILTFTMTTDVTGRLAFDLPALEVDARVTATVPGLDPAEAVAHVPELPGFERVAVSWAGTRGIELHAFEFGAGYDGAGHVWRGNPRSASLTVRGDGGFSTVLGEAEAAWPQMAEVYSYPARWASRSGVVRVTLEAVVDQVNCGKAIDSRVLQIAAGVSTSPVELSLAVPGCSAVGDFLVLNNLFHDLKIAAR